MQFLERMDVEESRWSHNVQTGKSKLADDRVSTQFTSRARGAYVRSASRRHFVLCNSCIGTVDAHKNWDTYPGRMGDSRLLGEYQRGGELHNSPLLGYGMELELLRARDLTVDAMAEGSQTSRFAV